MTAKPHFDAYLMVDWSARSTPETGKDSIWIYLNKRGGTSLQIENPATRAEAMLRLRELLAELCEAGISTLVGFDFAFGFPAGFAKQLGINGDSKWSGVWAKISRLVVDCDDNSNNRFRVASKLNRQISGGPAPFWNCPKNQETQYLTRSAPAGDAYSFFADRRHTEKERSNARTHSPFRLFTAGSVGSQMLLERETRSWRILYAEIFPSVVEFDLDGVKDKRQVEGLLKRFAELDESGDLSRRFKGASPSELNLKKEVECEEGWILDPS